MASKNPGKTLKSRDARLKAALKANMAKRKAQVRARGASEAGAQGEAGPGTDRQTGKDGSDG